MLKFRVEGGGCSSVGAVRREGEEREGSPQRNVEIVRHLKRGEEPREKNKESGNGEIKNDEGKM